MTIDVPTYKTQADPEVKISPLPCWLIPRAGGWPRTLSYSTRQELFYGITIKIIPGKKRRNKKPKNQETIR